MNKILVVVFDNETKAYQGLNTVRELHQKGDITVYASAVVSRDATGQVHIEQTADEGPIGTATGLLTGSLIGLLGGPIGLAIGAGFGSLTGLAFDIGNESVNVAFVDEVASALGKDKHALVAEIDESWTVPLDSRMEAIGGIVFRRLRYEVEEDQLQREAEAIEADYNELKEELEESKEAGKTKIKDAIANLKKKAQITNEQIRRKRDEAKAQMEAKVEKIEEQMKEAGARRKAKLQKQINTIKEEHKERTNKLKQASRLIAEAFNLEEEAAAA
jgi:uncharacterized membrane protein